MQAKKTEVAAQHHGRPPLQGPVPTRIGARSGRQSLAADLRSIISAAHLLPAEVAPRACGVLCVRNWKKKGSSIVP
jgi:hypothetical protein